MRNCMVKLDSHPIKTFPGFEALIVSRRSLEIKDRVPQDEVCVCVCGDKCVCVCVCVIVQVR